MGRLELTTTDLSFRAKDYFPSRARLWEARAGTVRVGVAVFRWI